MGQQSLNSSTDAELLAKLRAQPWGQRVIDAAQELGVDPVALAATAEIESDFGASTKHQSRHAPTLGVFQMQKLAYIDALKEIKRHDPELYQGMIQDSVTGRLDPANEAVAALGYLIYTVEGLERQGVYRPTFLDVRAAYNFGLEAGVRIAKADKNKLMKSLIKDRIVLRRNNIREDETVEDWRRTITRKIGYGAATSSVMK